MFKRLLSIFVVVLIFTGLSQPVNANDKVPTDNEIIKIYSDVIRTKSEEKIQEYGGIDLIGTLGKTTSCYFFDVDGDEIPELIFYLHGMNYVGFISYATENGKAKELGMLEFVHYQADSDFKFAYDGEKTYLTAAISNNVFYGPAGEYAEWEITVDEIMPDSSFRHYLDDGEYYIELSPNLGEPSSNFKKTSDVSYSCGQGSQRTDDESLFIYGNNRRNEDLIKLLEQKGRITEKEFDEMFDNTPMTKKEYEKEKNRIFHNPNRKYVDFVHDEIEIINHENLTNGKLEEYLKTKLSDWHNLEKHFKDLKSTKKAAPKTDIKNSEFTPTISPVVTEANTFVGEISPILPEFNTFIGEIAPILPKVNTFTGEITAVIHP